MIILVCRRLQKLYNAAGNVVFITPSKQGHGNISVGVI